MNQRILKIMGVVTTLALILVCGNLLGEKEREVNPQELSVITVETESDKSEVIMVAQNIQAFIGLSRNQPEKLESKVCNYKKECFAFDKVVVKSMHYKSLSTFDAKIKNGELIVYVNPLVKHWKDQNNLDLSLSVYHEFGSLLTINQK